MLKKITLDEGHSIEVNSSMGWLFIYRSAFGRDILPDIMPILESVLMGMADLVEDIDDFGELDVKKVFASISGGALNSAFMTLTTMEFITIIQILWAMAKNADKNIPMVDEWAGELETLPLDIVLPELFEILISSMASEKNAKSLQNITKKIKQTNQNESI